MQFCFARRDSARYICMSFRELNTSRSGTGLRRVANACVLLLTVRCLTAAPAEPCAKAISAQTLCAEANAKALALMNASGLEAFTVVRNVETGALLVSSASRPSKLDAKTRVLPLSLTKLFLAAAWWDSRQHEIMLASTKGNPNAKNPAYRSRLSVHDMLVGGSDSTGRELAAKLRQNIGPAAVLKLFERYGCVARPAPDAGCFIALGADTDERHWADVLSIGEADTLITGLQISRFLQAVGNGGILVDEWLTNRKTDRRILEQRTAQRLQTAMRDTVERGTAKRIGDALADTGWVIGGKTGTGPNVVGPESDGWFAGLVFDQQGKARFSLATFVRHGGTGGGNAARVSAQVARYLIGGGR